MEIDFGKGGTEYGPGVEIFLDGNEVAGAIRQYIFKQGVEISGASTVLIVDGNEARVYVDPSGEVKTKEYIYGGRGSLAALKPAKSSGVVKRHIVVRVDANQTNGWKFNDLEYSAMTDKESEPMFRLFDLLTDAEEFLNKISDPGELYKIETVYTKP